MDYEEKYKAALERARQFSEHPLQGDSADIVECIFSELQGNNDERIRKELITHCRNTRCVTEEGAERIAKWVAWLEKQGEQNFADKIEPKFNFKVGQWIVATGKRVYLIAKIDGFNVTLVDTNGDEYVFHVSSLVDARLWTIQDAKDGDALVASDGSIFLFAGVVDCACKYYVALTTDNYAKINREVKGGYWETSRAVYPATKEQRDLLFSKMKEAGYEWNDEKKELKKMEVISKGDEGEEIRKAIHIYLDWLDGRKDYAPKGEYSIKDMIDWPVKQGETADKIEPNPAWSGEDEEMLTWLCRIIHSQRLDRAITLKEESEFGEWIDKWLNYNPRTKQSKKIDDTYLKGIFDAKHEIEKQGEQIHAELGQSEVTKTSDKELEPKFHEGDWIISNDKTSTYQAIEVKRGIYVIRDNADNHEYHIGIEECEKSGRLWTIADAKVGDVLVCPSDLGDRLVVFIFKQLVNNASEIDCHCCIDAHGIFDPCLNDCCYVGDVSRADYIPATKEQRDLLFQKMKDAGYEWDAEKKELKKMEVPSEESDDERIRKGLVKAFGTIGKKDWGGLVVGDILDWLGKQGEKLDTDEVIEWIKNYASLFAANWAILDDIIEQFKKDFGL